VLGILDMDIEESGEVDLQIRSVPGEKFYSFPASYESSWSSEFEEQVSGGFFDTKLVRIRLRAG